MNEILIDTIAEEVKLHPGTPILLSDLRKRVSMSKKAFDDAVVDLAQSGKYFLSKHFQHIQSTKAEKALMISDGSGNFYYSINPREDAVESPNEPIIKPDEPVVSIWKSGRGGYRSGSGRPAKKLAEKRLQLTGTRLPGWLLDWLQSEGDVGRKIEQALVAHYGLTPPRGDDGK